MQVCDDCGACRELEWRRCPFCHADLEVVATPTVSDNDRFDALAAAAEHSDGELLPSPVTESEADSDAPAAELLTEHDLAHLTGMSGPDVNGWKPATPPPPSGPESAENESVPKLVVLPLVAAAVMAVAFVAYSIVTQTPPERPDTVALIDRSTTTQPPTTTTTEPASAASGAVPIGDDIAEQATRLCRGDQFSIARATEPSLAIYNDVMVAVQDGRDDWVASPDQAMLRGPVPPLVGCLRTADAGEIDRCPTTDHRISRRGVDWSYRVLRTIDGVEVASDSGVAREVRPCEELEIAAAGSDYGSWSPLPQARFDATAAAYTTAPHPQEACRAVATELTNPPAVAPAEDAEVAGDPVVEEPEPLPEQGLAIHATSYGAPGVDLALPAGWAAAEDRPVDVVLCYMRNDDLAGIADDAIEQDRVDAARDAEAPQPEDDDSTEMIEIEVAPIDGDPADGACTTVVIAAMDRTGTVIGNWGYSVETCPSGEELTVPFDFLETVVGPQLGYPVDEPEPESEPAEGE